MRVNRHKGDNQIGHGAMTFFFPKANLVATYCLKFGTVLKSWPKVKVCLSNNCWVISSKTKEFFIGPIILINSMMPIFLIEIVKLVASIDLVNPTNFVKLVNPMDSEN